MSRLKMRQFFWFALILLFLMSASFLLMPLSVQLASQDQKVTVQISLMFWGSGLVGYILLFLAERERRRLVSSKGEDIKKPKDRPGIIMFFSNPPAKVADIILIFSAVAFAVLCFTPWRDRYIAYLLLFLLFFSLHLHCLFNGRIYKAIQIKKKEKKVA